METSFDEYDVRRLRNWEEGNAAMKRKRRVHPTSFTRRKARHGHGAQQFSTCSDLQIFILARAVRVSADSRRHCIR